MKARLSVPQVKPRPDRHGRPWVFRYRETVIQPDGSVKILRKYREVAPSRGRGAITRKQAEQGRDQFLAQLTGTPVAEAVAPVAGAEGTLFSAVAQMYEEGYLGRVHQIATPTRQKERLYLHQFLIPRWGALRLHQIQPQDVEDWLHSTFPAWWTMHGVRAIMSRVFHYAEGRGLWEEGRRNPASKARLGRKRYQRERRILSFEETARVLTHLAEPNRLIVEICIATGARISEVLGLQWKYVDLPSATIQVEQRVWHQELGRPKSEESRRVLGIGELGERFRARRGGAAGEAFVFQQRRAPGKPLWDSGVRDALHQAAQAAGCDFPGLGPHSFRRANITWRQQVGGSAIEASKIAGHSGLEITRAYTFVTVERQNELTVRIQRKLAEGHRQVAAAVRDPAAERSSLAVPAALSSPAV